ncbi:MAG: bifunctional DNA primase/polymerase, partial [Micromonosporaceae bacterium]
MPGAYHSGTRFLCDRAGCPTSGCHPAYEDWLDTASCEQLSVVTWWAHRGHSVLLATGAGCDVIEVPAALGEPALEQLGDAAGPVAVTPTGSWLFFVRPGEGLRPELAERLDVLRHTSG